MKEHIINPESIRAQVEHIERIKGDYELAHMMEDEIYLSVLKAIAEGTCENPKLCAQEAVKSAEIDIERWYSFECVDRPEEIWE